MEPVVVLGAGGPTGSQCVAALQQQGAAVRAVVRDPAKYATNLGTLQGVELVQGDVTNMQSLRAAVSGSRGIIFAASATTYWGAQAVDCQGVANVAEAVKEQGGQQHVVLVSSCLVSPHNRWNLIRLLLNNFRWSLMDYKFDGEERLRRSGVPYTIVRPAGLTNEPAGQAQLVVSQGDNLSRPGRVSRADVAAVCVAALSDPSARNVTLELSSKPRAAAAAAVATPPAPLVQQLRGLFSGLKTDTAAA